MKAKSRNLFLIGIIGLIVMLLLIQKKKEESKKNNVEYQKQKKEQIVSKIKQKVAAKLDPVKHMHLSNAIDTAKIVPGEILVRRQSKVTAVEKESIEQTFDQTTLAFFRELPDILKLNKIPREQWPDMQEEVSKAGKSLIAIKKQLIANPALKLKAVTFYTQCVRKLGAPTSVQALCLVNYRSLTGKSLQADAKVIELANKIHSPL